MMASLDVSVILTFHNEGIVIHKTFLALDRMLRKLDEDRITYEIITHIDNGDEKTKQCIKKEGKERTLRMFENNFGEPSQSRNFAVGKAKGKYVCLMDGDDLFSENWLIDAYRIQGESKDNIVLHPECNLTFGIDEQPRLWRMKNSFDLDTDTLILLGRNRWCSGTFLKRSIAIKYPYEKAVGCYGFEDWHYNCETRAHGIRHDVVPGSVLFYRVRRGSTYSKHTGENTTIAYTSAFELRRMQKIYREEFEEASVGTPDTNKELVLLRVGHKVLRRMPGLRLADKKITAMVEKNRATKKMKQLPGFLLEEWKKMNQIDSKLYPDREIVSRMPIYNSELDYLGKTYCRLVHLLKKNPDYIFMPPILSVGGTEKVLENYLKAIYELHPEWYIVVLGRFPDGHPYEIPSNVTFVDFDNITKSLSDWDKGFLVTKLVVQTKVKRLHIIGNEFYYRWAMNNKSLIKTNNIALNCSFFMHEFAEDENRIQSFADSYFVELEPCINKIFTDNAVIAQDLINRTGIGEEKVSVHYQPVDFDMKTPREIGANSAHKILWASRVAPQKRPDILKRVAEKLPDSYTVDVYGRIQKPYFKDGYFVGAENINYKGAFNDVSKIPIDEYDVYLYTSQTDGIPNVLLEITALGLPIVATNEGGVSDFIEDGKSGRLVELNDIDGYVKAIVETVEQKKKNEYVKKAQAKLERHHCWSNYRKTVGGDLG